MPTPKAVSFLPLAIVVLATLLVGLGAGYLIGSSSAPMNTMPATPGKGPQSINSFEECAAAGYPIMDSYPEQCAVPGGRTYTRQIPANDLPGSMNPAPPQGAGSSGSMGGSDGMVACTMEAKLCPDGSAVGRQGPNCEFAKCPGE